MKSKKLALVLLLTLAIPFAVFADDMKTGKAKDEKEKVDLGNIAGGGSSAKGGSVDYVGANSEGTSVIGGSLSKVNGRWELKLVNNTQKKKSYNATVEVKCFDKSQRSLGTSTYSYSLSPGQQYSRNVTAPPQADSCMMNLVKAKDVTRKSKEEENVAAGDAEPGLPITTPNSEKGS